MNMAILTLADVVHEPTIDEVLDAVCAEFKLPVAYLQGPMRWTNYVRARHIKHNAFKSRNDSFCGHAAGSHLGYGGG